MQMRAHGAWVRTVGRGADVVIQVANNMAVPGGADFVAQGRTVPEYRRPATPISRSRACRRR